MTRVKKEISSVRMELKTRSNSTTIYVVETLLFCMDELVLVFLLLSVGTYVLRYVIRHAAMDFLSAIVSVATFTMVVQDESIPEKWQLQCIFLVLLLVILSFLGLATGGDNKKF